MDMSDDQNISDAAKQLIQQLSTTTITTKQATPTTVAPLVSAENLEGFVLQSSANLVEGTLKLVNDIRQYVASSPTPEDVASMAALINSSAAALEVMNKILLNEKTAKAKEKLKKMDIDSKKELQNNDIKAKLYVSREELLEKLIKDASVITVDTTESQVTQ